MMCSSQIAFENMYVFVENDCHCHAHIDRNDDDGDDVLLAQLV